MKKSTLWMIVFWVAQFILSFVEIKLLTEEYSLIYLYTALFVTSVLGLAWFLADTKDLGKEMSFDLKVCILLPDYP